MPRDLADVLHHLIPEAADSGRVQAPTPASAGTPSDGPGALAARRAESAALSVLAVPIGDRDTVRAGFVWNLAVEIVRLGAQATVLAPACDRDGALWPDERARPLGASITWADADDLSSLARAASALAARRPDSEAGGVVLVRVPARWLREPGDGAGLLRWTLLLSSAEPRDLLESYGLSKLISRIAPGARIGVSIHGTHRQGEARAAFAKLAAVSERRLGSAPHSYGLLVDDLQVYRAILAQRPIGLVHPQGPAARSLRDVAELLLADAAARRDA